MLVDTDGNGSNGIAFCDRIAFCVLVFGGSSVLKSQYGTYGRCCDRLIDRGSHQHHNFIDQADPCAYYFHHNCGSR